MFDPKLQCELKLERELKLEFEFKTLLEVRTHGCMTGTLAAVVTL